MNYIIVLDENHNDDSKTRNAKDHIADGITKKPFVQLSAVDSSHTNKM